MKIAEDGPQGQRKAGTQGYPRKRRASSLCALTVALLLVIVVLYLSPITLVLPILILLLPPPGRPWGRDSWSGALRGQGGEWPLRGQIGALCSPAGRQGR